MEAAEDGGSDFLTIAATARWMDCGSAQYSNERSGPKGIRPEEGEDKRRAFLC